MDKNSAVIAMFIILFFTVFLAVKQFLFLKNQVYQDAYNGAYTSNR